jgi:hypothetical protein
MKALLVLLALLLTIQSSAAQPKILVATNRAPVAIAASYSGGLAYPTICDSEGRYYVKFLVPGTGMEGPLFRLSSKGAAEAEFDTSSKLLNRYAARPDGGVIMMHSQQGSPVIDYFAADGTREPSVPLERAPVPFFPTQLAVFKSGEILISGPQYVLGYKSGTAIFDAKGHLVKQVRLDGDEAIENAIVNDTRAQKENISVTGKSVAITGDDGLVYLMRATSPVTVYAISSSGGVVRKIVVEAPSPQAWPKFGVRVAKNRLAVQFGQRCAEADSCRSNIYSVVDATTGKHLATYEAAKEAAGTMVCFAPDPDRFFILSQNQTGFEVIEAEPK